MMVLPPPPAVAVAACGATEPVRAVVERVGAQVRLRLLGRSEHRCHVRYRLVAGHGAGNSATQEGSATLTDADERVLLDLTQTAGAAWSAVLDVFVGDRLAYRRIVRSPNG